MIQIHPFKFWFVTGSQHLYGDDTLAEVAQHARQITQALTESGMLPYAIEFKPVVTTPEAIRNVLAEANNHPDCAGVIAWMHTFSPAKMWIAGLTELRKPILHLHTQFNQDVPWSSIDMDFMNLNQSAHGDREFGFIGARLRMARKVVAGHWQSARVQHRMAQWMRVAAAIADGLDTKIARFGDNMRNVAVTEGDKVEAQMKFGWSVNGYGVGDLVEHINAIKEGSVNALLDEYRTLYRITPGADTEYGWNSIREQARIELGLRSFLIDGGFKGFTTTFEDLHGMSQLPGLAVQRLMADGYGFGGEGDWKTAALLRTLKVMAGMEGTSFMEDYTYHLHEGDELVLGAHMLEVCPTIAADRPVIDVQPLGIGGKADPARLIFDGRKGRGLVASIIDMGDKFRLVVNEINAVKAEQNMPKLPVARVLWQPEPNLEMAAEAWIYAGGAHHTVFSYNITAEQLFDYTDILGIDYVLINKDTSLLELRQKLREQSRRHS
jgi:L-arabinose isomerase